MTQLSTALSGYEACSSEQQTILDQLLDTFFRGINERNAEICGSCYADTAVIKTKDGNDLQGKEGIVSLVQLWLDASSAATISPFSVEVSEGNVLSVSWNGTIVLTDCVKGLSPSGQEVAFNGVTHFRIEDQQVVEHRAVVDYSDFPTSSASK